MVYQLVVTRRAARDIAQLTPEVRERLRAALEKYREEPLARARKMVNSSLGGYRFRIGEYRVVFDLEGDHLVLLRVGHRRDIYRG